MRPIALRKILTVVLRPGAESTLTMPPAFWAFRADGRTCDSPGLMSFPARLVVKNGSNIFAAMSAHISSPLSATLSTR
jgi:hypothetical protein